MLNETIRDVLEESAAQSVSVFVYYADAVGQRVELELMEAVGQLVGAFDLEIVNSQGPIRGSLAFWFRARRRDLKEAANSELGKELGTEMKRAVQLRAVDAEQARVDDAKAAAVAKLIAAVDRHSSVVIQAGAILLINANGVLAVVISRPMSSRSCAATQD